jgi:hypothetical protein
MNADRSVRVSVALALGSLVALTAWAGSAAEGPAFISAKASELKWADAPSVGPGAKVAVIEGDLKAPGAYTFRLKIPADFKIPLHTHPVVERVTVILGDLLPRDRRQNRTCEGQGI